MKTFNETMVKNYREFNNVGTFEIEGYVVKFNNNTKELETEYPFASELRVWWFGLETEETEEKDKKAKFIKEHGFKEVTEVAIAELEKKTTKGARDTLDRIAKGQRFFEKDNVIVAYVHGWFTTQEKKQLGKIYKCNEMMIAERYFESIGEERMWNKLTYEERMSK